MLVPVPPPSLPAPEATSSSMTPPAGVPVVIRRSVGPRSTQPTFFGTEPAPPEPDSTTETPETQATPSNQGGEGASKP